ncbi:glycosyltransferase family 2 protein [Rhizobium sp. L80/93]|uniref:glycosyltransferase family 2 protein n=1 Tax=Rhizobium sp. E27B/91 TaxID=2819995 RepID=UPI001AD9EC54|nr:glycosyltransferase [Rhizobium sp. E27B/91]MBO9188090.1 glycosyltransferase [Rhizobium sp. E27B/91]
MALSWALAISTLNRHDVLLEAVKCAVSQTRPPVQVVIVDASDGWEISYKSVSSEMRGIPLTYLKAKVKSSSAQRNEAILASNADIIFLIDDDSLMYPDCAKEIMRVYEHDIDFEIAGIGATGVARSPKGNDAEFDIKKTGIDTASKFLGGLSKTRAARFFAQKFLLMKFEESFLPYNEKSFIKPKLPKLLHGSENFWATNTIPGYSLTVRTSLAKKHLFDNALRYYAAMEDADFCHRLNADGGLVVCRSAKVHHYQVSGGRLRRDEVTALQMLNIAVFLRRHSRSFSQKKRQYYLLVFRKMIAEFLKDAIAGRFSFPQVRGVFIAMGYIRTVFSTPSGQLDEVYPKIQNQILKSRSIISVR